MQWWWWWANGIKGQSPAGHKLVSIWGVWSDIWSGATQFRCMQAASLEVEFHFQLKATVQHSSSEFGSLVRHLVTSVYQCLLSHLRHRYNIRLAPLHANMLITRDFTLLTVWLFSTVLVQEDARSHSGSTLNWRQHRARVV